MAAAKVSKNDLIVQAVYDAMAGKYPLEQAPMFCLKVVRQVVERALGWPSGTFYKHYWTEKVEENKTKEPWARDLQRSLRTLGKQIPFNERKPGDLVFIWQAAFPYGHVGILVFDGDFIFENAPGDRGFEKGNIRISHLGELRHSVEVFRI